MTSPSHPAEGRTPPEGDPAGALPDSPVLPMRDRWSRRLSLLCAAFAAAIGGLGLLGWAFDQPRLAAISPGFLEIRPNSALGLLLSGLSALLLLPPAPSRSRRAIGRLLALPVLALASAAILSIVTGWRVGLDGILFATDKFPIHAGDWTEFPLRICLSGAIGLVLIASALLALEFRTRRGHAPSQWLAILAGIMGVMGLLGHAYDVDELHRVAAYTLVTAHAAAGLLALAWATFLLRPAMRPCALLWEDGPAGTLARRVLLPLLLVPPVAGWLCVRVWRNVHLDFPTLAAMLAALIVLVTTLVVGGCISALAESDRRRRRIELALRREESQLRSFLDSSEVIAWMKDEEGRYVFLSNNFLKRFGLRSDGWQGKLELDLWPRGDAKEFRRNDLAVLASGKPLEIIERATDREGNVSWWLSHKFPFRDEAGKLHVGGLGVDITRRKEAEEALMQSEARYRKLHETMTDAFIEVDMEGRVLETNRAFQAMLGYSAAELGRLTYVDLTPSKWHALEADIVAEQILPNGFSGVYEKEYRRKDGTVFPVELRTFLLPDHRGQPVAMWAIVRDITERKRSEETLRLQEAHLRLALGASNAGTWSWEAHSNVSNWDENYHALYGFTPETPRSHEAWLARIHPDDREAVQNRIAHLVRNPEEASWDEEFRVLHPTKGLRWMAGIGRVRRDEAGNAIRFDGINLDITERKLGEEQLRRARELNDELIRISEALHSTLDFDEVLQRLAAVGATALSSETAAISLREAGGWVVRHVHNLPAGLVGARMEDDHERHALEALLTREVVTVADAWNDARFNREHFRRYGIRAVAVGPLFVGEKPVGVIFFNFHGAPRTFTPLEINFVRQVAATATVAMEHARLFAELRESERALRSAKEGLELRVRERTAALEEAGRVLSKETAERLRAQQDALRASEREQQRIGADLHDGLCQKLVGINYMGRALEARLRGRRSAEAEPMAKIAALLETAVEDVRAIAHGLHPVKIEANGLMAALSELARSSGDLFGVPCEFRCPGPVPVTDAAAAAHLYRIAQEAVNNALRHGKPQHLTLHLEQHPDRVCVQVRDDGHGFPKGNPPHPGMGLRMMNARAAMIGASLTIQPESPTGVRVTCTWPASPSPTP